MGHTKGKWELEKYCKSVIVCNSGNGGVLICQTKWSSILSTKEMEANAERIVKCVNSHDELMKTLKGLLRHSDADEGMRPHQYKWIKQAQRLIKKDKGV